jgi:hypothetical protein
VNGDDRLVSRLLAGRDELSRVEKDALLEGVLAERPRRARWVWLALPAFAAAAAVVLLVRPSHRSDDELAARGGSAAFAALHVTCSPQCVPGGKLVLDLHGTTGFRYFAAFARRADGTVLWYFPASDDATSVAATNGVLDQTIVLGPEHPAGAYQVYGVFSNAPLGRAAIRDAFDPVRMTAGAGTAVVSAEIVVR